MNPFYEYIAASREGFIKQIVTAYLKNGYVFYVKGKVPDDWKREEFDEYLLNKYKIRTTRGQRYYRKQQDKANLQYIRFEDDWVMLATKGENPWFVMEKANIRKCTPDKPLIICGYSLSVVRGGYIANKKKTSNKPGPQKDSKMRVRAKISRDAFRELKAEFLEGARYRSVEYYRFRFHTIGYEPYAPVRKQLLELLRLVNKERGRAGKPKIKPDCIRYRQDPMKRFAEPEDPLQLKDYLAK